MDDKGWQRRNAFYRPVQEVARQMPSRRNRGGVPGSRKRTSPSPCRGEASGVTFVSVPLQHFLRGSEYAGRAQAPSGGNARMVSSVSASAAGLSFRQPRMRGSAPRCPTCAAARAGQGPGTRRQRRLACAPLRRPDGMPGHPARVGAASDSPRGRPGFRSHLGGMLGNTSRGVVSGSSRSMPGGEMREKACAKRRKESGGRAESGLSAGRVPR
jgi:hypothetical protein